MDVIRDLGNDAIVGEIESVKDVDDDTGSKQLELEHSDHDILLDLLAIQLLLRGDLDNLNDEIDKLNKRADAIDNDIFEMWKML